MPLILLATELLHAKEPVVNIFLAPTIGAQQLLKKYLILNE